jgi:hypothetical protein
MNDSQQSALALEWATLQNNHETYERSALLVKLVAIILFAIGAIWPRGAELRASMHFALLCFVLCALWMQEAILRTSQSRLSARLLHIESLQRNAGTTSQLDTQILQLHSEWQAGRKGVAGLLGEYARNALRPTVAFPQAPLAILLALLALAH